MKTFRFAPKYFMAFCGLLAIEVIIALFIHDRLIRPYVGDILVMFLMYAFIKSIVGAPTKKVPYYLFGFAVLVEILQLFNLVGLLGLSENKLLQVVLGSTFDFQDIACYFIGMLLLLGYEQALRKDISFL